MMHQNWLLLGQNKYYPWFSSVFPLVVSAGEPIGTALPAAADWVASIVKGKYQQSFA